MGSLATAREYAKTQTRGNGLQAKLERRCMLEMCACVRSRLGLFRPSMTIMKAFPVPFPNAILHVLPDL